MRYKMQEIHEKKKKIRDRHISGEGYEDDKCLAQLQKELLFCLQI